MDIIFYKLQDEVNDVKKLRTLTATATYEPMTVQGSLKAPTSKIAPVIEFGQDITYFNGYNYCYIADFNRYYFVEDMVSIRTSVTSISLRVDVLTSFLTQEGAGRLQAYVTRSENYGLVSIYDERVPYAPTREVVDYKPTMTPSGSLVNFSFKTNDVVGNVAFNYVFEVMNSNQYQSLIQPDIPYKTTTHDLDDIMPRVADYNLAPYNHSVIYVGAMTMIGHLLDACVKSEELRSNIIYLTAYPFALPTVGEYPSGLEAIVYGKDNKNITYKVGNNDVTLECLKSRSNESGYLVLADFTLDIPANIDIDPSVKYDKSLVSYEVYLPYYGYVNIPCEYRGHRLIVYYTIHYSDGIGIVNVADISDFIDAPYVIVSKQIQLGVQIPLDGSNNQELLARKQASLLNTAVSVAGGALATYAGYKTGNYRMMAYGVTGIAGGVASYANTQIKAIDKAETTVPSGSIGSYSPQEVRIRFTYQPTQSDFYRPYFEHFNGLPCSRVSFLSNLSGYTEIDRLHIEGTQFSTFGYLKDITHIEYEELENLCRSGIYL